MSPARLAPLIFACLLLLSTPVRAQVSDLKRLASYLTGTFTTKEQAHHDVNIRDLVLHVAIVWADRPDGPWLYVEQALAEAPDHPYRQRIYQLALGGDGVLEARIFELPDPVTATQAWKNPGLLSKISATELVRCPGCTLYLRTQPDSSFLGGTKGNGCGSPIGGSSYATSEIIVTASQTIIWDRGYNANGTQVWGSMHGGYLFNKQ
jgi:hypothetical protein